jgi:hypothetical protein
MGAVIPGRREAASPEPMNTDFRNIAWIVSMDPGFPRFARAPG